MEIHLFLLCAIEIEQNELKSRAYFSLWQIKQQPKIKTNEHLNGIFKKMCCSPESFFLPLYKEEEERGRYNEGTYFDE